MDDVDEDEYDEGDELGYREVEIREQDRFLPIANIARIMKRVLPHNAKIAKDSKESIQECVSEVISFITSEASEKCRQEKRKTINGDDILWAMSTLGFDKYVEPLKIYLLKYRDSVRGEKPEKKSAAYKKSSDSSAQPKRSLLEGASHIQYSRPYQPYNSSHTSVTGMPFLDSSPLIAPNKVEGGLVSLPPPPQIGSLQPPLSLTGIASSSSSGLTTTQPSLTLSPAPNLEHSSSGPVTINVKLEPNTEIKSLNSSAAESMED